MSFLKNMFSRKKPEAAPVQPAVPEQPVPAPAPAPAPVVEGGAQIRRALDAMAQKLISSQDMWVLEVGQRLQDLMAQVEDAPCSFEGFDQMITAAIRQMENLCQTCKPDQVNAHLSKVEAAIAARGNTEQNTDKFAPTMQTHYYSVMLVELQGRMNALIDSIARRQQFIDNVKTLSFEEQMANQETVMAFTTGITSSQMALMALRKQIAVCRGGLETARDQLNYDGPIKALDIAAVLAPIYQQNAQFQQMMEEMNRSANAFQVMHAGQVEEQMRAVALAAAARKQQQAQIAQTQMLTDSIQAQMAELTGQNLAPAAAEQSAAAQQVTVPAKAKAVIEPEMPAMPDVFGESFDAMSL